MKRLKELGLMRWQMLLLGVAVLVAIGYLAYFVWKAFRIMDGFVKDNRDDDPGDPDPDDPDDDEPKAETVNAGNNGQATEHAPAEQ